jgi:ribosomal protein S12 methylthiotransferase
VGIPGVALRTTLIVGFQVEAEFETLLDFIERTRFERLGIFKYSQEEGSRVAKMPDQIRHGSKTRHRIAMSIQQQIAQTLREQSGKRVKVAGDQPHIARSEADAPDIDTRVVLSRRLLGNHLARHYRKPRIRSFGLKSSPIVGTVFPHNELSE